MKSNSEYIADHVRDLNELKLRKEMLNKEIYDIDTEIAEINKFIEELNEVENEN